MKIQLFVDRKSSFAVRKSALIVKNWPSLKWLGYPLKFHAIVGKFKA